MKGVRNILRERAPREVRPLEAGPRRSGRVPEPMTRATGVRMMRSEAGLSSGRQIFSSGVRFSQSADRLAFAVKNGTSRMAGFLGRTGVRIFEGLCTFFNRAAAEIGGVLLAFQGISLLIPWEASTPPDKEHPFDLPELVASKGTFGLAYVPMDAKGGPIVMLGGDEDYYEGGPVEMLLSRHPTRRIIVMDSNPRVRSNYEIFGSKKVRENLHRIEFRSGRKIEDVGDIRDALLVYSNAPSPAAFHETLSAAKRFVAEGGYVVLLVLERDIGRDYATGFRSDGDFLVDRTIVPKEVVPRTGYLLPGVSTPYMVVARKDTPVDRFFYPEKLFAGGRVAFFGGWGDSFRNGPINRVREKLLAAGVRPGIDVIDLKSKENELKGLPQSLMFDPSEVKYHEGTVDGYVSGREGSADVVYLMYPEPIDTIEFVSHALRLVRPSGNVVLVTEAAAYISEVERYLKKVGADFSGKDGFSKDLLPISSFSNGLDFSVYIRLITKPL